MIKTGGRVVFEGRDGSADDEAVVREMFKENVYQLHTSDLEHSGVVVDIGANIGAVTVWAASRRAHVRVIAVEPQPDNRELLERNIILNNVAEQVTVLPVAVSDRAGSAWITNKHGGSRLRTGRGANRTRVPVTTLDELLSDVDSVDVLKIDAEGSEYAIISGASDESLEKVRYLVLEFHDTTDAIFGGLVARLAHFFNIHMFGHPDRGGALYGRCYWA